VLYLTHANQAFLKNSDDFRGYDSSGDNRAFCFKLF